MSIGEENLRNVKKSIEGGKPARQPFLLFLNFPLVKSMTGVELREYFEDPKIMMDAQIEVNARLGLEGPICPDYGIVAECSAMGSPVLLDGKGFPSIQTGKESSLEEVLRDLQPGDPWGGNWETRSLETLEYMISHVPPGFCVENPPVMAPFTIGAEYRGIEEFCVELYEEPEMIHELLRVSLETLIRYCREQQKILGERMEHILICDDTSGFLTPDNYRKFVMPYLDKFYGEFPGVERWLHNDADSLHLSELIAEAGFKFWHTGRCFSITEARKRTGGKVSLCGNLSPVEELLRGTPKDVADAVNRQIKAFNGDSRYILGTGGFISYGTPEENLRALIQTVWEQEYRRE